MAREMEVRPGLGWRDFDKSDPVCELLVLSLADWHYLGPTSHTSIWAAPDESDDCVYVEFDDADRIVRMVLRLSDTPRADTEAMLGELARRFGVEAERPGA